MKQNIMDALSNISGISKKDIKAISNEIVANNRRLDSCNFHEFTKYHKTAKRWTCKNCDGYVNNTRKNWYEKGLKHGRS